MVDNEGKPLINNTGRTEYEQRPKFSDCLAEKQGKILGVISIGQCMLKAKEIYAKRQR